MLAHGVTCAEVKSGYGLNVRDELKMLEVVQSLRAIQPVELVPTLLCAHAIPTEQKPNRAHYVDVCVKEIIPEVASRNLARFCDVFTEEGAFSLAESERILVAGKAHGLIPRLHADQLTASGASGLAATLHASSADHLEEISEDGIRALADAGVVAVLMPTSTLFMHQKRYAPGRKLWDAGVPVALGTNVNPGSAMSENHALTLGLGCLLNGLTAAEAYWAATRGAAMALRLPHHGELVLGGPADLVVFSCPTYRHLPYHLGVNHVRWVVKSGNVVVQRGDAPECGELRRRPDLGV